MHHLIKTAPLLLGLASLSACSALGLGQAKTSASAYNDVSGTYTQLASNTHGDTASDYDVNSGWYAGNFDSGVSPFAGGAVVLDVPAADITASDNTLKMAHNGYHDAYGNPVNGPTTGPVYAPGSGPMDTTYVTPSLRGSYGPSYYGNIGAIMYDVDDEIFGLLGRVGIQKNWYAAEIEGSFGVIDEEIAANVEANVDYAIAGFAVGRLPIGQRFNALGRVGYHATQLGVMTQIGGQTVSVSEDFDGIAYGAGLEYDIDGVNGLRFDYTRYNLADDITSDSLAATYLRRF